MAPRYSRHPEGYRRPREEWDDRDVVPPRDRFAGPEPGRADYDRQYQSQPYQGGRGGAGDPYWMERPMGAGAGMPGMMPAYDDPYARATGHAGPDRRPGHGYAHGGPSGGRDFFDKATDEVASWFGDEDAERRREEDHRGRGPRNYVRSDARIEEDVNDRLTEDRVVDAREITVTVQDREVTLDGHVASRRAKRRAEDCADSVSGVTHVQNNLRVKGPEGSEVGAHPGVA